MDRNDDHVISITSSSSSSSSEVSVKLLSVQSPPRNNLVNTNLNVKRRSSSKCTRITGHIRVQKVGKNRKRSNSMRSSRPLKRKTQPKVCRPSSQNKRPYVRRALQSRRKPLLARRTHSTSRSRRRHSSRCTSPQPAERTAVSLCNKIEPALPTKVANSPQPSLVDTSHGTYLVRRTYTRRKPLHINRTVRPLGTRFKSARSKLKTVESAGKDKSTDCGQQKNHEAFVTNFAIPTHLYRYLAQRHHQKPLYLDRNLSYLHATPPSFSHIPLKTNKRHSRPSVDSIAERLLREQHNTSNTAIVSVHKPGRRVEPNGDFLQASINELRTPVVPHWPKEIQLIFEGFFDSEKELDWVTVEASVGLFFRFGWAWRHKASPADTVITPFAALFPLTCYNPSTGLEHSRGPGFLDACRFQPMHLVNQAKRSVSAGRLNSGQLELRVTAIERRWLKRPDLSKPRSQGNGNITHLTHTPMDDGATNVRSTAMHNLNRKGGFGSSAYPVHYSTAPLPLFYPTAIAAHFGDSHPFLLAPGLYELRLGVDHTDRGCTIDKYVSNEISNVPKRNGEMSNGYHHHHETSSTTDSMATSTSEFPTGCTVSSTDEVVSVNDAGAASGRVEWCRIRFPRGSDALDEYSRWPRLKFRVVWRGTATENDDEPIKCDVPVKTEFQSGIMQPRKSPLRNGIVLSPRKNPKSYSTVRSSVENGTSKSVPLQFLLKSPPKTSEINGVCPPTLVAAFDTTPPKSTVRPRRHSAFTRPHLTDSAVLPPRPVIYRFVFRGQLQQWSESKDLICPWCQLDCWRARERGPEALLVHLRTCHPRFRFKASWSPSRSQLSLEVSLNEAYDGSNDCGVRCWSYTSTDNSNGRRLVPPGQLIGGWTGLGLSGDKDHPVTSLSLAGCASRVPCPVRRLPYTHLIFWRGAERVTDQPLDPTLSVRPMAIGHNRVYYHTRSVQPIRACEFDFDSEAEDAPDWLRQHYQRKVEEFTDVNQGEKQIMQLWNALLLSIGPSELVVCDTQLVNLAAYFLHCYAQSIHRRRLRSNLILHFANLVDYGLLSAGQLRQLMSMYDSLVISTGLVQQS
ncbi:Polycomb protein Su(Z)12 [Paragonimus heterotremus]|uniref:Polycomb protein Su(Z)12 n=1 Tax=Paragonimus heterotremus TaxID=100268 RepID=A0A8J4TEN7_9TREM|nr:Polycomb protein Su(Z)12 [Paragonimus heterotremus]